jgi:hypothetical protein
MKALCTLLLVAGLLVEGCAGSGRGPADWQSLPYDPGPTRATAAADEGGPLAAEAQPGGSFRLALAGVVDPAHAPEPRTGAETHVFRNLYETLVRLDAEGEVVPALAASWAAFDGGRTWVFRLRPAAAFWDGTPVRAADVAAAWPAGDDYAVAAAGADSLVFQLPVPSDSFTLDLAHPRLAISGRSAGGWPLGTGPCRPASGARLVLVPNRAHPRPALADSIVIVTPPEVSCTALDRDSDAVVLRETCPRRPGVRVDAMPRDVVYLLVVPPEDDDHPAADRLRWATGYNPRELLRPGLAAADDLFLVAPSGRLCENLPVAIAPLAWPAFDWPSATASLDRDLVLYPDGDPVAATIAEAVARYATTPRRPARAVAGRGPLTPDFPPAGGFAPAAAAVPPSEFPGALQSGRAGAYVLPWPRRAATACGELADLLGLAGWLQDAAWSRDTSAEAVPPSARAADPVAAQDWNAADRIARRLARDFVVTPLVTSRSYLAAAAGLAGLTWDFDGALDLARAGWADRP